MELGQENGPGPDSENDASWSTDKMKVKDVLAVGESLGGLEWPQWGTG